MSAGKRLPVYLLLDGSGSMTGESAAAAEMGARLLVEELRADPFALETVWLGALGFASHADELVPLTPLERFEVPAFETGGSSALGEALELLEELAAPLPKTDWRPAAFLFTDGEPTDRWRSVARRIRERGTPQVVVCGAGSGIEAGTLRELSSTFVSLRDAAPGTLSGQLQWLPATAPAPQYAGELL